jgi:poly-beta-1,6-N-acetyl-D-glucosamine N-deacetylase
VKCYTADGETINTKWVSEKELLVKAKKELQGPRDRYTCTAPAKNGKWFWYSHLWIVTSD